MAEKMHVNEVDIDSSLVRALLADQFPQWAGRHVEESTYLAPERCANTTREQRRRPIAAYWERGDPDFVNGDGAESFRKFGARAATFHRIAQDTTPPGVANCETLAAAM